MNCWRKTNSSLYRVVKGSNLLASPELFDIDVVFLHFRNDKPLAEQQQVQTNLTEFAERGGGLVAMHFACGALGDWPEYRNLVGGVWDGENTHDPRGAIHSRDLGDEHPITRRNERLSDG
ncbi:MAG: hypothetical protein R3C56_15405 [Pirellulaceae bacterium]